MGHQDAPPAEIRRARVEDAAAIGPLLESYRRFYHQPPDPAAAHAFVRDRLEREESVVFVADVRGALAGFTQLYPLFSTTRMKRLWLLSDLFVDPVMRTGGIGRLLMRAAEEFARSTGACDLILETAIDNLTAQALYESEGYVRDQRFYRYELNLS